MPDPHPTSTRSSRLNVRPPGAGVDGAIPWHLVRAGLLVVYVLVFTWSVLDRGLPVARLAVLSWVAVALVLASVGRPVRDQVRMLGDMAVYTAMWLAYDRSRGMADGLGMPLQVEAPRNIDRFLFAGTDPAVWLQGHLYQPEVRWYDVVFSLTYFSHFFLPVALAVVLWITDRGEWVRYLRRFATVLLGGVLGYVLVPTAPPWMAAGDDLAALPPLVRPTARGWDALGLDTVGRMLLAGQGWSNPTAAMPSLHAAGSLVVVLWIWPRCRSWWLRAPLAGFPLLMAVTLVYFAEHYVIDVLAGWALVVAAFWWWDRWESRRDAEAVRGADAGFPAGAQEGAVVAPLRSDGGR